MTDNSKSASQQGPTFAELLNGLFATHLGPRGRPYSLREVSEGTGGKLSIAYLSLLRRGGNVGLPSADKVKAIAKFFGVDIDYFLGAEPAEQSDMVDPRLVRALADPQVRDIALRASAMSGLERQFLVRMLEQTHQMFSPRSRQEERAGASEPHREARDTDETARDDVESAPRLS